MSQKHIAPHGSGDHTQSRLASSERQDHVLEMRNQLAQLCYGLDRQPRWFATLKGLVDNFRYLHGQDADCSVLNEAVPPEDGQLVAPQPQNDLEASRQVRDSFLNMAPHLLSYLKNAPLLYNEPLESWNLPPAAQEDPRAFWAKVFDSFDFSSPQYFDTTLPLEQQPKDAYNYLANFDIMAGRDASLACELGRPRSRDNLEFGDAADYREGCRMLNEMLDLTFGIRVRPRKQDPAIPFPWLDCRLSRFTALGWTYKHKWHHFTSQPYWEVDYGDAEHPYDPLHRSPQDEPFSPYIWLDLLITNVRVPLPLKVQDHPPSLGNAMTLVYSEFHPLQMLGEARSLIVYLHGDECSDTDLRAAMLYQLISTLSKSNPDIFDILTEERLQDYGEEEAREHV